MLGLQKERLARGWTQKFVGEKCGITKQSVCNIEKGLRKPSYELVAKFEDLFGLNHRELMKECPLDHNTGAK